MPAADVDGSNPRCEIEEGPLSNSRGRERQSETSGECYRAVQERTQQWVAEDRPAMDSTLDEHALGAGG